MASNEALGKVEGEINNLTVTPSQIENLESINDSKHDKLSDPDQLFGDSVYREAGTSEECLDVRKNILNCSQEDLENEGLGDVVESKLEEQGKAAGNAEQIPGIMNQDSEAQEEEKLPTKGSSEILMEESKISDWQRCQPSRLGTKILATVTRQRDKTSYETTSPNIGSAPVDIKFGSGVAQTPALDPSLSSQNERSQVGDQVIEITESEQGTESTLRLNSYKSPLCPNPLVETMSSLAPTCAALPPPSTVPAPLPPILAGSTQPGVGDSDGNRLIDSVQSTQASSPNSFFKVVRAFNLDNNQAALPQSEFILLTLRIDDILIGVKPCATPSVCIPTEKTTDVNETAESINSSGAQNIAELTWWEGQLGGKSGCFPLEYCQRIDEEEVKRFIFEAQKLRDNTTTVSDSIFLSGSTVGLNRQELHNQKLQLEEEVRTLQSCCTEFQQEIDALEVEYEQLLPQKCSELMQQYDALPPCYYGISAIDDLLYMLRKTLVSLGEIKTSQANNEIILREVLNESVSFIEDLTAKVPLVGDHRIKNEMDGIIERWQKVQKGWIDELANLPDLTLVFQMLLLFKNQAEKLAQGQLFIEKNQVEGATVDGKVSKSGTKKKSKSKHADEIKSSKKSHSSVHTKDEVKRAKSKRSKGSAASSTFIDSTVSRLATPIKARNEPPLSVDNTEEPLLVESGQKQSDLSNEELHNQDAKLIHDITE